MDISGTAGTKASEDLVNQVRKYTSLDEFDSKGITTKLSSAAKPDLGKENVILPKNSKIIFDDLQLKGVQQFRDWFQNKYKNLYSYQVINDGHKQFIVNKLV